MPDVPEDLIQYVVAPEEGEDRGLTSSDPFADVEDEASAREPFECLLDRRIRFRSSPGQQIDLGEIRPVSRIIGTLVDGAQAELDRLPVPLSDLRQTVAVVGEPADRFRKMIGLVDVLEGADRGGHVTRSHLSDGVPEEAGREIQRDGLRIVRVDRGSWVFWLHPAEFYTRVALADDKRHLAGVTVATTGSEPEARR